MSGYHELHADSVAVNDTDDVIRLDFDGQCPCDEARFSCLVVLSADLANALIMNLRSSLRSLYMTRNREGGSHG